MPRKQKKYHYLYKTTNLINNKFYAGMHSTDDLNDGYLGSGKHLRRSINKYGKHNFKFEILEFFEDRKTLIEREKIFVNEDLIKEPLCMNLMKGGEGGFISIEQQYKRSQAGGIAMHKKLTKERISEITHLGGKKALELKVGIHDALGKNRFDWTNKKHTEATKNKIREKAKLRIGEKNSQFGTCWIMKESENKKIKKEELNNWIKIGWIKGRKQK